MDKIKRLLILLDECYPTENKCYLNYGKPYELLIATILSAQCTDNRVNIVTDSLFQKYVSLGDFAAAEQSELETDIKSTGFYHNKAKNIIASAKMLLSDYGGTLPNKIEELTKLPGVGRKTANVILGHIFGIPSIVVDTHVMRVSALLGITNKKDPEHIEFDLMHKLPIEHWIKYNTQIIAHGRGVCIARRPKCPDCRLQECCAFYKSSYGSS